MQYLEEGRDDDHSNEQGVLVQALENIPLVEDGAGVELVKDLAEDERVEEDAERAENRTRKQNEEKGGGG